MMDIRILGIRLNNGDVAPLAWTDREISNKELRRLVRKFRTDTDFIEGIILPWKRLYSNFNIVKNELPRI